MDTFGKEFLHDRSEVYLSAVEDHVRFHGFVVPHRRIRGQGDHLGVEVNGDLDSRDADRSAGAENENALARA